MPESISLLPSWLRSRFQRVSTTKNRIARDNRHPRPPRDFLDTAGPADKRASSADRGARRSGAWLVAPLLVAAMVGPAAAAPARCDDDEGARTLKVSRHDWLVACLQLEDGRRVAAAVPLAPLDPHAGKGAPLVIRLALARGDNVAWRDELRFGGTSPEELREVLAKSEEWLVSLDAQPLGALPGIRVSVFGHWGGATMLAREIALLYRLPADAAGPLKLVWSGVGNTRELRGERCLVERVATFQLVDDHTLERQVRLNPVTGPDAPTARRRRREPACVIKPEPAQRFSLQP